MYSSSSVADEKRTFNRGHSLKIRPPRHNTASAPAMIFFAVMRHETQNAVAPSVTSAKIGMPAREIASTTLTAAEAKAAAENQRSHFGSVEVAAAIKIGATVQRYMEKLFGSSIVPGTR